MTKVGAGYPIGTLSQDNTRRLADFGFNDHPFVPIAMFVDSTNSVRYQFHGDEGFFTNNFENTMKNMVEVMLKKK